MSERLTWPEAEIIAEPVKKPDEPKVLVRRRQSGLCGPNGEELIYLNGPAHISLFTGAGGMDIGVEQAGFSTLVQHEWRREACLTLMCNRPSFFRHAALIQGDICETPTSMLLEEAGLRVGEAHLVTGGPPCQGFSTASTKANRGVYDERNDLVYEFLRVVRESQPKFFVFENVPGFVQFNKGEYFKTYLRRAYECYYELVYGLVDACDYGVPQRRIRFICMGTRRDMADIEGIVAGLPKPEFFAPEDLQHIKVVSDLGSLFYDPEEEILLQHSPGIRYFPDREILVPPHPKHSGHKSKKFIEFFRRLRKEEPDRIVETQGVT